MKQTNKNKKPVTLCILVYCSFKNHLKFEEFSIGSCTVSGWVPVTPSGRHQLCSEHNFVIKNIFKTEVIPSSLTFIIGTLSVLCNLWMPEYEWWRMGEEIREEGDCEQTRSSVPGFESPLQWNKGISSLEGEVGINPNSWCWDLFAVGDGSAEAWLPMEAFLSTFVQG